MQRLWLQDINVSTKKTSELRGREINASEVGLQGKFMDVNFVKERKYH